MGRDAIKNAAQDFARQMEIDLLLRDNVLDASNSDCMPDGSDSSNNNYHFKVSRSNSSSGSSSNYSGYGNDMTGVIMSHKHEGGGNRDTNGSTLDDNYDDSSSHISSNFDSPVDFNLFRENVLLDDIGQSDKKPNTNTNTDTSVYNNNNVHNDVMSNSTNDGTGSNAIMRTDTSPVVMPTSIPPPNSESQARKSVDSGIHASQTCTALCLTPTTPNKTVSSFAGVTTSTTSSSPSLFPSPSLSSSLSLSLTSMSSSSSQSSCTPSSPPIYPVPLPLKCAPPRSCLKQRPSRPTSSDADTSTDSESTTAAHHNSDSDSFSALFPLPLARQVSFANLADVREYGLVQRMDTVPHSGGYCLGLDWQYNALMSPVHDDASSNSEYKRRYPSPNKKELLVRINEKERKELLQQNDVEVKEELNFSNVTENDMIRSSRMQNFCSCSAIEGCKPGSCQCIDNQVGCHVEGDAYCNCCSGASKKHRKKQAQQTSCGNPFGQYVYNRADIEKHRGSILRKNMGRRRRKPRITYDV